MSEDLKNELAEIKKIVEETQEKLTTTLDEILEAIELSEKNATRQLAEIDAYLHNVIEPNQQQIWNGGIGAIIAKLEGIEKDLPEQEPET